MDYNILSSDEIIEKTAENIRQRGIEVFIVPNGGEAMAKIKESIPAGATIMNGSSTTLEQIGFIDFLNSFEHPWKNMHEAILKEEDAEKKKKLRKEALLADYFLGSVNAIAETGELVAADASGSRIGAYPFAAGHVLLVSGANKIVPTLDDAMKRVWDYVYPLENERAKKAYGSGSAVGKMLIISKEIFPQRTILILVKQKLGF